MQTMTDHTPDDSSADADNTQWLVLINAQGQHALWPVSQPAPAGWTEVGPEGQREDCLAYIDQHWTDMRPVMQAGKQADSAA